MAEGLRGFESLTLFSLTLKGKKMSIQDIIYWVGVVFVWVVLTFGVYARIVEAWYKYSVRYAVSIRASSTSMEDIKIASGWITGIIWSVYTVVYTLCTQWFYHNIWRG